MKFLPRIILALGILAFLSAPALAATTSNSSITPQTPKIALTQFLQGTDTALTYKAIYTGNANGSIIKGLYLTGNDPSATHLVTCEIVNATIKYGGMAITVPTTTPGYASGVGALNLMSATVWPGLPVDADGNPFLYLGSASDSLQCTFATALTASDKINIVAVVADF